MNILILASDAQLALEVLKCLAKTGARVDVLGACNSPLLRISRLCAYYGKMPVSAYTSDTPDTLNRIVAHCANRSIDCVVPADLPSTHFVARHRDRLSPIRCFPTPAIDAVPLLHNKWRFARFCDDNAIPHPETILLESPIQANSLPFEYPVIVKPLEESSNRGVRRFNTSQSLVGYLNSGSPYAALPLLVQRFVEGLEIDLSLFALHGEILAWTVQTRPARSTIRFVENMEVLEIGEAITTTSGYSGVAHIDFIVDPDTEVPLALDFNPRFWGTLAASLFIGVNFAEIGLMCALGESVERQKEFLTGDCLTPSESFNRLVTRPFHRCRLDEASARSLESVMRDPLPYLYYKLTRISNRLDRIRSR